MISCQKSFSRALHALTTQVREFGTTHPRKNSKPIWELCAFYGLSNGAKNNFRALPIFEKKDIERGGGGGRANFPWSQRRGRNIFENKGSKSFQIDLITSPENWSISWGGLGIMCPFRRIAPITPWFRVRRAVSAESAFNSLCHVDEATVVRVSKGERHIVLLVRANWKLPLIFRLSDLWANRSHHHRIG